MDNCKHVTKIRPNWNHSCLNPQKWLCYICGTTESVWACLSCPNVACGRFNEEHALKHYQESKHPLSIEVNNKYVYCKNCAGLDRTIDKVSDLTNTEIVEIIEYDYDLNFHSEEDLQLEIEANTTAQIHEMPDEIKVIHIEQNEFDVTGGQTVQILNEEGVEIMYDEISLPQEEITVDGNQVIYQVEIDGRML
ncbi:USP44_49 [Mytilus edulis]|uniref:USP44_49 n=1 Tax=Mytilus edulis TaxID=6550 RepID=A0A8S3UXK8_MYTED|nr:USP44_49 [Mytilus edulis]